MATASAEFATKLLVPQRRDVTTRRQRLIDLLLDHIDLRIQVVSAPAGYGKTTLLVDFASDVDTPVCWYSLDPSDQDPRLLLEGILASIHFRFPSFGELSRSRLLAAQDVMREASQLVGTLTGEILKGIPEYFVLVLDDFHFVEDSDSAKTFLNLFVEHAPDNCHIIVSSRTQVELPVVSTLVIQQQAVGLSTSDLSFTPREVKELLDTHYDIDLSDEEADRLAADTDGWIISILLRTHNLRGGAVSKDMLAVSQWDVFQYLTLEVYERQPPNIREFLLASSVLDYMEPQICDLLLGITNSRTLLHLIEKRNLFVHCIDREKAWYRYHHLFRQLLQDKLEEQDPKQSVLLHWKAGSLLEQEQRWNDAISHFLTARRYDEALRVVRAVGEDFQNSGKWTTVSKWVEALPRDMRRSDPDLVLLHAQSLIHLGEVDEAARILTGLLNNKVDDEDWLYRAKALSWRSAAFRLTGHFTEAKSDIDVAIHLLEQNGGPANILSDAYRRLGSIHAEQGRFRAALKHMRRALKYCSSVFDVSQIAGVHNSMGILYKCLGDLEQAAMHFELAREGWQKTKNFGALAITLSNIAYTYHRRGQYELALDTLRFGLEKARETGYRRAEALILIAMAETLRDLGSYDEALTAYGEGLELAREVMETYYVASTKAGMGETYRLLGDYDKAEVFIKEAISQVEAQGQSCETSIFSMQLGIIEYERGRYETATEILQGVCDRLKKMGDRDALVKSYLHLAQASFLARKYALAIEWLRRVSRLADELGYDDFLAIEGRNAVLLIQYGASQGIGDGRFVRILEKIRMLRGNQRIRVTTKAPVSQSIATRPDIEARTLGETQVLVDSRLISEAEWRSNRAKEVFFYLLCCGAGQTKERITAALWPDLSPAKATSNFHINLYRARRAIFPGVVTLEQGQYRLNPDLNIWSDVVEFISFLSDAEGLPHGSKARVVSLEQAVDLYKGPFMKDFYGEWIEVRRRELEDKYLEALSLLAGSYGARGEYERAITLLERLIATDPYQDDVYCQVMEWHLALEDKVSALRTYRRYLDTLVGELKSAPSARMQDLHHRLVMSGKMS